MVNTQDRIKALAEFLECEEEELEESSFDETLIEYGSEEYLVLTENEADEAWEERLDSYLEECVLPELPENMRNYFDDEAWKRDARFDGRGHAISTYDGEENEVKQNGSWFFIYRVN